VDDLVDDLNALKEDAGTRCDTRFASGRRLRCVSPAVVRAGIITALPVRVRRRARTTPRKTCHHLKYGAGPDGSLVVLRYPMGLKLNQIDHPRHIDRFQSRVAESTCRFDQRHAQTHSVATERANFLNKSRS
jgi:hypothetical protein